jgi:S-adenosylmethionine synthetase
VRRTIEPLLRPDGKSQVTVAYDGNGDVWIDNLIVSAQHSPALSERAVDSLIRDYVLTPATLGHLSVDPSKVLINPTGPFTRGGPETDAGLTGRKIIVDTYGGMGRHGGGAFSGKDPSKVDRSAAYMARYVAKNVVAALGGQCEVSISYSFGLPDPVALNIRLEDDELSECVAGRIREGLSLRPGDIIQRLDLLNHRYLPTASYGHFGRSDFSWEGTGLVETLGLEDFK